MDLMTSSTLTSSIWDASIASWSDHVNDLVTQALFNSFVLPNNDPFSFSLSNLEQYAPSGSSYREYLQGIEDENMRTWYTLWFIVFFETNIKENTTAKDMHIIKMKEKIDGIIEFSHNKEAIYAFMEEIYTTIFKKYYELQNK